MTEIPPSAQAELDSLRQRIRPLLRADETGLVRELIQRARFTPAEQYQIIERARPLVSTVRAERLETGGIDAFLNTYDLSSREGIVLMCMAEALLRIPDAETVDRLIKDKIGATDWAERLGASHSLFVNASTWALMLTGRLINLGDEDRNPGGTLGKLVARVGEPVIRQATLTAMRILGKQFVMGRNIDEALERSRSAEKQGYRHSYDMLGEAARTSEDALRYFESYANAIKAIGKAANGLSPLEAPSISVKLSALHPRYEVSQFDRVSSELLPTVKKLALLAKQHNIGFTIDAEESDRLEISLDIIAALALDPELAGWNGLGLAVQAYLKRALPTLDWLAAVAKRGKRRLMVRLVKGAYWDAEIKMAQERGLSGYPVFTRKQSTDISYLACAKRLFSEPEAFYPAFATHNAHTLSAIAQLALAANAGRDWEYQRLHGMGEELYDQVVGPDQWHIACRVYAPVGSHEDLLAYLVRRLLENGANSSFVHRIADPEVPVEELIADPAEAVLAMPEPGAPHPAIALPSALYAERRNSAGLDLSNEAVLAELGEALRESAREDWRAGQSVDGTDPEQIRNPADHGDIVGHVWPMSEDQALQTATRAAASGWAATPLDQRCAMLERAADAMEAQIPRLMGLIMREAGKSAANAIAEVREAVDFLRYYPQQARLSCEQAAALGPVVCISPWNFPLAIFTGQVAAALAAGNPVLAKPSSETPLIAAEAVRLLHGAGVPQDALHLVPGGGAIGAALVGAPETAGVVFTGSTGVARSIQRQLAGRLSPHGAPIPLIAETGGQNAMVVDSSALTEQVVADVLASAFDSAGQRCSALRVLCLQEDVADRTLAMLKGAMAQLRVGSTDRLEVDVGPVISERAQRGILAHIEAMRARGHRVTQVPLGIQAARGTFVAPTLIEIESIAELETEVFGPVLHVVRFRGDRLGALIDAINATGYGLTFGLHTRMDATVERVTARVAAGNLYVNRNMIGAVVGVQPFGGRGLSGTGPKAGGPLYVPRLTRDGRAVLPGSPAEADPALAALADWGAGTGLDVPLPQGSRLVQACELPGPVGERNVLRFHPRGRIGLLAASETALWSQIAAVLATGNVAVVVRGNPDVPALARLPAMLRSRIVVTGESLTEAPDLSAALVEGPDDLVRAASRELAARDGAVVTLHTALPGAGGPLWPLHLLLEEVTLSVNTTAAGGNASLMALA